MLSIATKPQSPQPPLTPSAEHQLLDVFVGKWHTEGLAYAGESQSTENPYDSAVRWSSEETYEWLPGGFFLLRHFNGPAADVVFNGIEIIGYDASSQMYSSHIFDNYGNALIYQVTVHAGVWTYTGTVQRATYVFSDDGNTMTVQWEWLCGADWFNLSHVKVTKMPT